MSQKEQPEKPENEIDLEGAEEKVVLYNPWDSQFADDFRRMQIEFDY